MTVVPFWCLSHRCIFELPLRTSNKQVQDLKETMQLYEAIFNAWYEEGCAVAPFKSGEPSNLGAPSDSVLQRLPFQLLNIIVCRRFELPPTFFKDLPLLYPFPLFRYISYKSPVFGKTFPTIPPQ